jgi:mono/diheme cytochrome c family protein
MKNLALSALTTIMLFQYSIAASQDVKGGEKLFTSNCKACHSIGKGKIVGPDLQNVTERRSKEWLHKFIPQPMKMIESGDPVATKLFEEHNKIPMPDQTYLKASEIDDILAFVKEQSSVSVETPKQEITKEIVANNKKELPETKPTLLLSSMDYFVYSMLGLCFMLVTFVLFLIYQVFKSIKSFEKKSVGNE